MEKHVKTPVAQRPGVAYARQVLIRQLFVSPPGGLKNRRGTGSVEENLLRVASLRLLPEFKARRCGWGASGLLLSPVPGVRLFVLGCSVQSQFV